MTSYGPDALAAHLCRARDLAALIGLLAVLEGEIAAGEVSDHLADRLRDRLGRAGLGGTGRAERELRQAISDLNHRLRYALGEYHQPPESLPVPE
ncbi:hypothetical protein [Actinoplanes sp. L3-i22]|uniref:hypothetical protein n=1 Tax=Actinoplanes sp. L3-i22 TaxID=2836373 RepID=UPI001C7712ED|nr:hypothetical protein [Actinoplanes sp. L3-i22]BCY09901.1 hypothetical protein L3i22_049890 [Actinoplanes sp. L3-i22]